MARFAGGRWPSAHIPLARTSSHSPPVREHGNYSLAVWPGRRENPFDEVVSAAGWKEAWPYGQNEVSDGSGLEVEAPRATQEAAPQVQKAPSDINSQD